jgi:hypothetical protein
MTIDGAVASELRADGNQLQLMVGGSANFRGATAAVKLQQLIGW